MSKCKQEACAEENIEKDTCECNECHCDEEQNKLNDAYNKISELEDAVLRSKAEFINYRKRLEDETSRIMKYANEGIVKELLPIIDNFERAIKIGGDDELLSGFNMVYGNLVNVLTKYEIKEIDCQGKPFDPMTSQAVIQEINEDYDAGVVIEVLQKGYTLKDKVIRPAMVKVSE